MEDNSLVNKESVEALIALTDSIRKADEDGKIVKYDLDKLENLYDVAKKTEGISAEEVTRLKNISRTEREKNQGRVIDFASLSEDELYFALDTKVCTELYEIFRNIEKDKVLKIPEMYLETIRKHRDIENPVVYNWDRPLIDQSFEDGTIRFLNWVCYNFWLENDEEKEVWRHRQEKADLIEYKETLLEKLKKLL